ncbi:MAG: hypothetical protein U0236_09290 [Nitrospira sp.]
MLWVSPKRVAQILGGTITILSLAGLGTQLIRYTFGHDYQFGLNWLFDLNMEGNLPAWYASTALASAATLLGLIGAHKRDQGAIHANHWLALSIIFFYLSLDEAISIHEAAGRILAPLQLTGVFHYNWVVLGIGFVCIVGGSYLRFLKALPPTHRWRFVVAGLTYVTGALGIEMIESRWAFLFHGPGNLTYAMLVWIEETLEMIGVAVFIYALWAYIEEEISRMTLSVPPSLPRGRTFTRTPGRIHSVGDQYRSTGTDN